MNPLIDTFPTALRVGDAVYPIHSDFRTAITILLAFEDPTLTACERMAILYDLLYEQKPPDIIEGCRKAVLFLDCGEECPKKEDDSGSQIPRLYSLRRDAPYLYAAFREAYGIDLEREDMHWWKFCYLFGDLPESCMFHQLVTLRRRRAMGRLTPEEQRLWYEMEEILELPQPMDAQKAQAEYEFNRAMGLN